MSTLLVLQRLLLKAGLELRLNGLLAQLGKSLLMNLLQLGLQAVDLLADLAAELVNLPQLLLGIGFILAHLLQPLRVLLLGLLELAHHLLDMLDLLSGINLRHERHSLLLFYLKVAHR
ncbi:MAG: hypothetical protein AB1767_10480 [Bacillota bacterium]